ncbi:MAG: glycerate-2-kinase family protein [Coprothermobacterota bacterium]|nr:glycerate-2-kinase family protein [Coprothermobacterota bacterium]
MKEILESCFREALRALDPYWLVKDNLHLEKERLYWGSSFLIDLKDYRRVLLAGLGKAAPLMAQGIMDVLGDAIEAGLIVSHHFPSSLPEKIRTLTGSHPIPDEKSLEAGKALYSFLSNLNKDDLVIFITTGGGSAIAIYPQEEISLEDKALTFQALISAPLTIREINSVRRKLSRIKGGGLARVSSPATVINLVISDVVGDDLATIASGPFVSDPDPSPKALEVIASYNLEKKIPTRVMEYLRRLENSEQGEARSEVFQDRIKNLIVASNLHLLKKCQEILSERGIKAHILSSRLERGSGTLGPLPRSDRSGSYLERLSLFFSLRSSLGWGVHCEFKRQGGRGKKSGIRPALPFSHGRL